MPRTIDIKRSLEMKLAAMHNRKHCILVSRGATAIYLALKAFGYKRGKVALPSMLCMSPANAVMYAGLKPVFIDISLSDFNMEVKSLKKAIEKNQNVVAVILPHIYGQPGDIDEIVTLCKKHNIRLIEDAAPALGGSYKGSPLGAFGDISILSFGHTKILDCGGGGALLFDDDRYFQLINALIRKLPSKIRGYRQLQEKYSKKYYALANIVRRDPKKAGLYSVFPQTFKNLYLFKELDSKVLNDIRSSLNGLQKIVKTRNENAALYSKLLNHPLIIQPKYKEKGTFWRYSFLVKGGRQHELAQLIREKGVAVSNWYAPLHLMYRKKPAKLKNAEYLGDHVFNLWVDESISKAAIRRNCDLFIKVLNERAK